MGTSPRLINIDPNSRSSTVQDGHHEEEGRAEVQAARHPHPHPSQASVDHAGPSSTALRHGSNLQARTARQSQPSSVVVNSDPTGHPRNTAGLVATPISTHSLLLPTRALLPSVLALSH